MQIFHYSLITALAYTLSLAAGNAQCTTLFGSLNGSEGDPVAAIANAGNGIEFGGITVITAQNTFGGNATGNQDGVNDKHLDGCVGPKLGIQNSVLGINTPGNIVDYMTTTYQFSPAMPNTVDGNDFCFNIVDIDKNDEIIINLYDENDALIDISELHTLLAPAATNCVTYAGNNTFHSICNTDDGGYTTDDLNNSLSGAIEICPNTAVRKIQLTFYTLGEAESGSYSLCTEFCALPIDLAEFTATEENCNIELNWETASETNFSHFEIQKSSIGTNYTTIAEIEGIGTESSGANYDYTDRQLTPNNYYRLKMVDNDGMVELSEILTVSADCAGGVSISNLYPNPVTATNSKVRFTSTASDQNAKVVVMDALSRIVSMKDIAVNEGTNVIEVETTTLQTGMYMMYIGGADWRTGVVKFIKQ